MVLSWIGRWTIKLSQWSRYLMGMRVSTRHQPLALLGGGGHESVRAAARRFVGVAEKYYADAISTTQYPYPKPGHVLIYLTCFDGVRVIDTDLSSLESGKDRYSDLWAESQNVVTELRLIAEKPDGEH